MNELINRNKCDGIIFGGDFNLVEDRELDRNTHTTVDYFENVNAELKEIKVEYGLLDVFRSKHPYFQKFTFRATHRNVKSRLDRFYVSNNLLDLVQNDDTLVFVYSDHDCYFIEIKAKNTDKICKNIVRITCGNIIMKF